MNTAVEQVYIILLAAGASRRMGSPKQLIKWQQQTLLEQALQTSCTVFPERVILVLGAHAALIRSVTDLAGVRVVENPDWQEGIAASIRIGVQNLPESAAAALLFLCDQPLINSGHLQNILDHWQRAQSWIVASSYHDTLGVPALIPAKFFPDLLALKGDRGAKALFGQFAEQVLKIPLPEAELDVDQQCDVANLSRRDTVSVPQNLAGDPCAVALKS